MPIALPLVTRQEIVREYRPDETVTVDSGIRALRAKQALSAGLSIETRSAAGHLGGRVHVYSTLNRDAARAARRKDFVLATRLCKAAARLEASPEAKGIAAALSAVGAVSGAADLARALATPELAVQVAGLQRKLANARRAFKLAAAPAQLNGHVVVVGRASAMVALNGLPAPLPVPLELLHAAGVGSVGAAVTAMWELLPGGRTLMTVEPAIDTPDVNDLGEPLVDLYGTPWGQALVAADADALTRTGEPTVTIPAGIPDVE